jgi:hypothetical protein
MSKVYPAAPNLYEPYDPFNSALVPNGAKSAQSEENQTHKTEEDAEAGEQYLTSKRIIQRSLTHTSIAPPVKPHYTQNKWWEPILPFILPVVDVAKQVRNPELEIRLGTANESGEFVSGVSKHWFLHHIGKMESADVSTWTSVPEWTLIEEYVFQDGIRVRRSPRGLSVFIRKVSIKHYDVPLRGAQYDLRLMLKSESPAQLKCGEPLWVRFKERKSFTYKNSVTYDFTKVWEGRCIAEAQRSIPKYEIEIECINVSLDREYIAKSLLLKCSDLLTPPPHQQLEPRREPPIHHNNRNQHYNNRNQRGRGGYHKYQRNDNHRPRPYPRQDQPEKPTFNSNPMEFFSEFEQAIDANVREQSTYKRPTRTPPQQQTDPKLEHTQPQSVTQPPTQQSTDQPWVPPPGLVQGIATLFSQVFPTQTPPQVPPSQQPQVQTQPPVQTQPQAQVQPPVQIQPVQTVRPPVRINRNVLATLGRLNIPNK